MRRIAMETFGESKNKKREDEEENSKISKKKKNRNSGSGTIEYLREKKNTQEMPEYPRKRVADEGKTARIGEAKIWKFDAFDGYTAATEQMEIVIITAFQYILTD